MNHTVRGCLGAVVGAAVGVAAYYTLLRFVGLNAIMVIGVGTGIGASLARAPGAVVPIVAGLVAASASVVAEWWQFPFTDEFTSDKSLLFFVRNLNAVAKGELFLIAVGIVAAVYLAWTRPTHSTERAAT